MDRRLISGGADIVAVINAVINISAKIFELCQKYAIAEKEARKDIQRFRNEVISLQDVITDVRDMAEDTNSSRRSVYSTLNQPNGPVQQCGEHLRTLLAELELGDREHKMKLFRPRALKGYFPKDIDEQAKKWPFSNEDIDNHLETINDHKATFTHALTSDNFALTSPIKDDAAIRAEQKALDIRKREKEIQQWLSSPDPSSNHNAACKARQTTTGEWFLNSIDFEEWKMTSRSFLWLYGIPGCGKTVLCSTVVEDVKSQYKSNPAVAIAYFYFDFNDTEKQKHDKFTRSLVEQLAWQSVKAMDCLKLLYSSYKYGKQQLTQESLELTLRKQLGLFKEAFIILDGLDECKEREKLFTLLKSLTSCGPGKLHVLTTSRREQDIEEALGSLVTSEICLQSAIVDVDIHTHLSERLENDSSLSKWPANVRQEIEQTLMDGAQGRFRWLVCQLDLLRKCLELDALRKVLKSLPKSLDETYARLLVNIDEEHRQDAFRILQWLVYSARPLRVEEVVDVVAIDTEKSRFNPQNRLADPQDLLVICPGLVKTVAVTAKDDNGDSHKTTELWLAHSSVKEYLISDRIRNGLDFKYDIQSRAEEEITQACLTYLLHFKRGVLTSRNIYTFPLAWYAAEHWYRHFRAVKDWDLAAKLSVELFQGYAFENSIRFFDPDPSGGCDTESDNTDSDSTKTDIADTPSGTYYASLQGLLEPLRLQLEYFNNVNLWGGYYGNALQAAAAQGHHAVATFLLEKRANVNAQGGFYGTALQAASAQGHEAVATLLLEKRANVNIQGGFYGNALQAASAQGHEALATLLLDRGAGVNDPGGQYDSALFAASENGHKAIVSLLLERGADIDTPSRSSRKIWPWEEDENRGNALYTASYHGHEAIVLLLLEKGADISAQGGHYGNALQAAINRSNKAMVTLLLEKGADVNLQSGFYGTALQAASYQGDVAMVKLLLKKGADVNVKGGDYGNALQAASTYGYVTIATLLLEKGADVNAQRGSYHRGVWKQDKRRGNALYAASKGGYVEMVSLLLRKGADVNAQGGDYGHALQAAAAQGHEAVVTLILEKGADVNAKGGEYGYALKAALRNSHQAIATMLLEKGATTEGSE